MRRLLNWSVIVLLSGSMSLFGQSKKRVALMDFEFGTVQQWWSGNWDIGKGIADMIVTDLVKDGTYSVIGAKNWTQFSRNRTFQTQIARTLPVRPRSGRSSELMRWSSVQSRNLAPRISP